ncbi:30S ribosomal protein S16 [Candidatus Saccharibacteria bacterium]|nr:30S ribosomal protein S16 [Candidatus Saccharibacteria bacterium]
MLAIRMQRTGRKGHAQYRLVVQDSRRTPTSGKLVSTIGSYNPHTKETVIDKTKAEFYLKNGAQPSDRVATLLKKEGVRLPNWVELPKSKTSVVKNAEKLRKNQPKEEPAVEETITDAVEVNETEAEVSQAEPTETAEQETSEVK